MAGHGRFANRANGGLDEYSTQIQGQDKITAKSLGSESGKTSPSQTPARAVGQTDQQETNMSMVQSLDNASQPFRPRHDELVPSRYALKVGDIDVLVISDGVLH